jgi:hypothetical protein
MGGDATEMFEWYTDAEFMAPVYRDHQLGPFLNRFQDCSLQCGLAQIGSLETFAKLFEETPLKF